jgi:hypothetical protein
MKTFYTRPDAGAGDGSEANPFGGLLPARDAVRKWLATHPGEQVSVELAVGTYYLSEPIEFGLEDSGSPDAPVLWRGSDGANPIISAGRRLDCQWMPHEGSVLKCSLAGQVEGQTFSQLYINGRRQVLARYPNGDSRNVDISSYLTAAGADDWPHSEVYFDPDTFTQREWSRPEKAIVHIFPRNYWGNTQYRLEGVDREGKTLRLGAGGWQLKTISESSTGLSDRSRYFVENLFEELDAPSEWYFDDLEEVLYWYPEEGIDAETAMVEVSLNKHAVEIVGAAGNPVRHVIFEGISFAHTERTFLERYEIPSMGDWSIYRGGAVRIAGAEDIAIRSCRFDGIGGNGVFVDGYAARIGVSDCSFSDIGESAVCLVGESHLSLDGTTRCEFCGAENPWGWGEPSNNHPRDCVVANNVIHNIGVFGKQTAGVFLSLSECITVAHNHIFETPRAAICINDGLYGGHTIEYNDIHDTVRETGDHGPFNSWGREPFWCRAQGHGPESHPAGDVKAYARETSVIRFNRFRDSSGWGIDLDDGSSYYHVFGNLCIGISVKLREGVGRVVENNIFYKGVNPPAFHRGYEGNGDRYARNIVVMDSAVDVPEVDANFRKGKSEGAVYDIITPPDEGPWFGELDRNLFSSDIGAFRALVHFTRDRTSRTEEFDFDRWRGLGFDAHSLFADPGFIDPDNGDFRLKENSPAFDLGFERIPLDQFGPKEGKE